MLYSLLFIVLFPAIFYIGEPTLEFFLVPPSRPGTVETDEMSVESIHRVEPHMADGTEFLQNYFSNACLEMKLISFFYEVTITLRAQMVCLIHFSHTVVTYYWCVRMLWLIESNYSYICFLVELPSPSVFSNKFYQLLYNTTTAIHSERSILSPILSRG